MYRVNSYLFPTLVSGCLIAAPSYAGVPVPGTWTVAYDWECDGSFSSTRMTVNPNRTWVSDEGYTGKWIREAGIFIFNFDVSRTTYSGNIASKSITGINTTFRGLKGCFYMLQDGVPNPLATEQTLGTSETIDSEGSIKQ